MSWIAVGIAGAAVLGGLSTYLGAGDEPKVPDFPKLDLDMLQKLAIGGNLKNLSAAQELAAAVNKGNLEEVRKQREGAIPGAIGQIQKNIMNELSGVADVADTKAAIANATAANFSLGAGGASQFSKFAVVGKLGRSVAQQRQQGFSNFGVFANIMDAPRFDPASMFLSPGQRVQNAQVERQGQFDVAMAKAAIKAQPSKTSQALSSTLGIASNLVGMWAGSKMGGGAPGQTQSPTSNPVMGSYGLGVQGGWNNQQMSQNWYLS